MGYGNVGSRLAEVLSGFGCRVVAYDKYVQGFSTEKVEEVTLTELQTCADVVSLHVPLTGITNQMVDGNFISKMQKPFYLLNLARGKVVKLGDIISGLESGKIKGLALDVLPNENLKKIKCSRKRRDVLFD